MAVIELTDQDISCAICKDYIEGDLAAEPGIKQVTVNAGTWRIQIVYDQQQTSPEQLGPG